MIARSLLLWTSCSFWPLGLWYAISSTWNTLPLGVKLLYSLTHSYSSFDMPVRDSFPNKTGSWTLLWVPLTFCTMDPSSYLFVFISPHFMNLTHRFFPSMEHRLKGFKGQMHPVCGTGWEGCDLCTLTALGKHRKNLRFWHFQVGEPFGMNHMSHLSMSDCVQQMPSALEACGDWEISVDHVAWVRSGWHHILTRPFCLPLPVSCLRWGVDLISCQFLLK